MNHDFRKLTYWQKARSIVKDIYKITRQFPADERFCLVDQMRRAGISIPSNIAEGCGRRSNRQLSHFLDMAQGSTMELETQLIIAYDLEYISEDQLIKMEPRIHELQRMNTGFKASLIL